MPKQIVHGEIQINTYPGASTTDFVLVKDAEGVIRTTTIAVSALSANLSGGVIGTAEDGVYTDGLFTDFVESTPVGTAVDRFNEVLKSLAPSPAPALDNISIADTGVAGKLSFGATNAIGGYTNVPTKDINDTIGTNETITDGADSVVMKGIFNASTTINGTLNDDVAAEGSTPNDAYPANAFGDGDQGSIQLWVNGSQVHSVDLTVFGSGSTVNGNGSGFNLSAATNVQFPNGDPFDVFKYRTGTWTVDPADQRNGYNRVEVRRVNGGTTVSNIYGWVVDDITTATSYASESLSGLSMTGSKFLSGVEYHTGGTATYGVTVSNLHRNTYSSSGSAISHPTTTNCSVSSSSLGTIASEADTEVVSKTATVDSGIRILNGSLTVNTRTDRTVQSDINSTGVTSFNLLVDGISTSSTSTSEDANDEVWRVASNVDITATSYNGTGTSPADWDSTISLVSATAGYSDGLLVENGTIKYPTQGTNGGNFSTIANGPAGNVDYSGATGNRVYLRYFYDSSSRQNFRFNVNASSTSFVSVATGPSANNLTFEVLAPNTTTDGVTTVWKDATVAYSTDNAVGCYASTFGSTIPTAWGCTLGGKSTATAGNVIVVRITASSAWTGSISDIDITWL